MTAADTFTLLMATKATVLPQTNLWTLVDIESLKWVDVKECYVPLDAVSQLFCDAIENAFGLLPEITNK